MPLSNYHAWHENTSFAENNIQCFMLIIYQYVIMGRLSSLKSYSSAHRQHASCMSHIMVADELKTSASSATIAMEMNQFLRNILATVSHGLNRVANHREIDLTNLIMHLSISHNAPLFNRNVNKCAHFYYKVVYCQNLSDLLWQL